MIRSYSFKDSLWRTPGICCALGLSVLLSSCASDPSRPRLITPPVSAQDARSELVFLNIAEASGWVAYNCNPEEAVTETENYRIVVIRERNNELIYDSTVPLAADLCTHGFEMAPEDPRLQKLGRNVDTEIIEPLEAYQRTLKKEKSSSGPEVREESSSSPDEEELEMTAPSAAAPRAPGSSDAITISGVEGDSVLLDINGNEAPVAGDRFFLRTPPETITIPGTGEQIVSSEGGVTGLVEIESVENGTARAKLLSGSLPESGVAEKATKP